MEIDATGRPEVALRPAVLRGHQGAGGGVAAGWQGALLGPAGYSQLSLPVMRCRGHWVPGRQFLVFMSHNAPEHRPVTSSSKWYRVLRASEGGPRVSSPRSAARSEVPEGPEKWKLCQQGDSHS